MEKAPQTKSINGYNHILYFDSAISEIEMEIKVNKFYNFLDSRRSVRDFVDKPVSKEIIEKIILSAGTAPSGAHKQPWIFCAVSDPEIKKQIREAAEAEEKESYESRMSQRWKDDLKPIGTDMNKPFLETAPWLIIVFKQVYEVDDKEIKHNNYYVNESVGIACGMLISAIHNVGLITLTHTPSPMNFLSKILNRPASERAFLLLPVGHAASIAYVPDLQRKTLDEIAVFY